MKQTIITILLLLATCLGAAAQSNLYNMSIKEKNLKTVYISKDMLNSVKESSLKVNKFDFNKLIYKTNCIEIVTADSKGGVKKLDKIFGAMLLSPYITPDFDLKPNTPYAFKLILDINEDCIHTKIYSRKMSNGDREYLLSILDECFKDYMSVVLLSGSMTPQDIRNIKINKQTK